MVTSFLYFYYMRVIVFRNLNPIKSKKFISLLPLVLLFSLGLLNSFECLDSIRKYEDLSLSLSWLRRVGIGVACAIFTANLADFSYYFHFSPLYLYLSIYMYIYLQFLISKYENALQFIRKRHFSASVNEGFRGICSILEVHM